MISCGAPWLRILIRYQRRKTCLRPASITSCVFLIRFRWIGCARWELLGLRTCKRLLRFRRRRPQPFLTWDGHVAEETDAIISIHPSYADAILAGEKTIELRRRIPNISQGARLWIYATRPIA